MYRIPMLRHWENFFRHGAERPLTPSARSDDNIVAPGWEYHDTEHHENLLIGATPSIAYDASEQGIRSPLAKKSAALI